jgi:hypothetical protein
VISWVLWGKVVQGHYLVYLPVGHTHKKVDGVLFARIGKLKKFEKCKIPEKFRAFVAKAFCKSPLKPDFDENMLVWDWKAWLHPHLRDLKGVKDFQAFRFTLNKDSDPVIMYKNNILDSAWLGFEGSLHDGIF